MFLGGLSPAHRRIVLALGVGTVSFCAGIIFREEEEYYEKEAVHLESEVQRRVAEAEQQRQQQQQQQQRQRQ